MGGAALAATILEVAQEHRSSIGKLRQVCMFRALTHSRQRPSRYDVRDQGSVYRLLVEGLYDRATLAEHTFCECMRF